MAVLNILYKEKKRKEKSKTRDIMVIILVSLFGNKTM